MRTIFFIFLAFLLTACGPDYKAQLKECENDFNTYKNKVNDFVDAQFNERYNELIKTTKKATKITEEAQAINAILIKENTMLSRKIADYGDSVAHFEYCDTFLATALLCDFELAEEGKELKGEGYFANDSTFALLIAKTLLLFLLPFLVMFAVLKVIKAIPVVKEAEQWELAIDEFNRKKTALENDYRELEKLKTVAENEIEEQRYELNEIKETYISYTEELEELEEEIRQKIKEKKAIAEFANFEI